jgi:hypothetical protein
MISLCQSGSTSVKPAEIFPGTNKKHPPPQHSQHWPTACVDRGLGEAPGEDLAAVARTGSTTAMEAMVLEMRRSHPARERDKSAEIGVTHQPKVCNPSAEGLLRPISRTCTPIWLPLVDALRTFLLDPTPELRETIDHVWFTGALTRAGITT